MQRPEFHERQIAVAKRAPELSGKARVTGKEEHGQQPAKGFIIGQSGQTPKLSLSAQNQQLGPVVRSPFSLNGG